MTPEELQTIKGDLNRWPQLSKGFWIDQVVALIAALEAAQAEKRKVMDSIGYRIVHEQGQTGHNSEYRVKLLRWVLSLMDAPTSSDQADHNGQ